MPNRHRNAPSLRRWTGYRTRYAPRAIARLAARLAFNLAFAFCCFSYATTSWQASQRLRMRDLVVNIAPQRRQDLVMVSSNGRMPGFWGSR